VRGDARQARLWGQNRRPFHASFPLGVCPSRRGRVGGVRRPRHRTQTEEKGGVRQIANDQFEVTYDPAQAGAENLKKALEKMGYGASLNKAIGVRVDGTGLMVESQADQKAYGKGKSGKLTVGLSLPKGSSLGETTVKTEASEGVTFAESETKLPKVEGEKKLLQLEFKVGAEAKLGEHPVKVTVTYTSGDKTSTIELSVPVTVE
jgi:hypothetical protein